MTQHKNFEKESEIIGNNVTKAPENLTTSIFQKEFGIRELDSTLEKINNMTIEEFNLFVTDNNIIIKQGSGENGEILKEDYIIATNIFCAYLSDIIKINITIKPLKKEEMPVTTCSKKLGQILLYSHKINKFYVYDETINNIITRYVCMSPFNYKIRVQHINGKTKYYSDKDEEILVYENDEKEFRHWEKNLTKVPSKKPVKSKPVDIMKELKIAVTSSDVGNYNIGNYCECGRSSEKGGFGCHRFPGCLNKDFY